MGGKRLRWLPAAPSNYFKVQKWLISYSRLFDQWMSLGNTMKHMLSSRFTGFVSVKSFMFFAHSAIKLRLLVSSFCAVFLSIMGVLDWLRGVNSHLLVLLILFCFPFFSCTCHCYPCCLCCPCCPCCSQCPYVPLVSVVLGAVGAGGGGGGCWRWCWCREGRWLSLRWGYAFGSVHSMPKELNICCKVTTFAKQHCTDSTLA